MRRLTIPVFVALCAVLARAADTHPFGVHDMLAMDRVGRPLASPDGSRVAFTVSVTDMDANGHQTDIWVCNADGNDLRRLTNHESSSFSPHWSADGDALFFLSRRSGSTQVWRISLAGGEAEQITNLPLDINAFRVSPRGTHLALSLDVFPEASDPDKTRTLLDEQTESPTTGRIYDQLLVRHWDTWKDGRRSHLFAYEIETGKWTALMKSMPADVPSKPFGGDSDFTFTPDGKAVVFSARTADRKEAWSTDFDLYRVNIDGSDAPTNLTPKNSATLKAPTFSHDGKRLAWLAMKRPGFEADRFRIVVADWPNGTPRVLTEPWDRSPHGLVWSRDGRSIYCAADHHGQHSMFAIDATSGDARILVETGAVRGIAAAKDAIVFGLQSLTRPTELYRLANERPEPITRFNRAKLEAVRMGTPEQFTFKGWNDETVYAYVVKPVDFNPDRRYPIAFLVHGGPQGSFGNDFHYRWNPQFYAGAGYAAIMIDFHGSTGYGQAFTDSISGHWGDRPLEDLQKGLAAALERYPWMDGEHVAALGASYGGYMINWIAGNWPTRFRCLVNHDGIFNERMAYYDTEELWFPEWEYGGPEWQRTAAYDRFSPINHVDKWQTPMLVIHGQLDYRVVDTQGIATFTALQRKGIPSRLLYFPDENHWVLKPHNSVQWHETVLDWLDRWTKE